VAGPGPFNELDFSERVAAPGLSCARLSAGAQLRPVAQLRLVALLFPGAGRMWALLVMVMISTAVHAQSPTATTNQSAGAPSRAVPLTSVPQASQGAEPPSIASSAAGQSQATVVTNPLPPLAESIWSKAGARVDAVHFHGVNFPAHDPLFGELEQKAGQPLDPVKVRDDLRRLFATGRYRNIAVYGEPVSNGPGAGIDLTFAGSPRFFVGRITVVGVKNDQLTSLLEFATKLDPGSNYTLAELPAAVTSVKQTLAHNGYYQPKVSAATSLDEVNDQVNVTFTIQTGPRARVGSIAVNGADAGISIGEFRKQGDLNCSRLVTAFDKLLHKTCDLKVGRETVSNALSGVRSFYQKEDRLEGTISLQSSTYVPPRKQLDYGFGANQGPVVKVVVDGAKLSKSRTRLLVPVYQEGAVDIDLLNEGAFNIKDYLQQKGYFDVTDKVQLLGKNTNNVTVQYTVVPGRRHKVTEVNIKGNKYFDDDTIGTLLRVKKGDLYQPSGRYSAQLVGDDVSAIENLYRANGFSDVKVTSAVKDFDKAASGQPLKEAHIWVTYTVEEGSQQKFGAVELSGISPARQKAVRGLLSSQAGQPFSYLTLTNDRDSVLGYYLSNGFEHARVEIAQQADPTNKERTNVTFDVTEGEQVFIDRVLVSGIVHTRPSLVESQTTLHAGAPLDQAALLQTQRNLYNLALFNEVNTAVQDPSGAAPSKNVLVQITEAKRWDVTYGFGFEAQTGTPGITTGQTRGLTAAQNGKAGVSPRVSLDVSRINLRGTQDSLTLHTTYGLLEKVATLSFNNPQLFGKRNLTGTVSGGYSNVQNITTFASSTLQGDFRVTQKVKRADTFIYSFEYRRVSVNPDSLEITPNLIPQLSQPVIVGGPQLTYFHDTRDPNPLNANKGQFFSLQEFTASSKFGSDTDFNRLDLSQSSYYTFGKHKYVFARNLRVGFENAWGPNPNASNAGSQIGVASTACSGTLLQTNATCYSVPLPERLFAGGATSHRGFGINDAGPRDLTTGYPVGGGAVVVNSFELRLPPPTLPFVGNSLSFVIFHDMGNVFEYPREMFSSIRHFHQPNQATCRNLAGPLAAAGGVADNAVGTCDFNYYSHALGLGLRYATPVGPIRVDFTYNLDPPIYPVFNDYTSAAPYVGQASHFNFFFSIGQAF
jgi:outer membrane protein insertion porin family